MKLKIANAHVKHFCRAITALAEIGDILTFIPTKNEGLIIINSSRFVSRDEEKKILK